MFCRPFWTPYQNIICNGRIVQGQQLCSTAQSSTEWLSWADSVQFGRAKLKSVSGIRYGLVLAFLERRQHTHAGHGKLDRLEHSLKVIWHEHAGLVELSSRWSEYLDQRNRRSVRLPQHAIQACSWQASVRQSTQPVSSDIVSGTWSWG